MTKGLIFKCTNRTEAECFVRSVFGADKLASDAVLAIEPGDSLFLLNVQSDRLMGVFEADSSGQRDLVSEAWGGRYPFQVKVRTVGELKIANGAKSALDALILKSHQILQHCEADVLAELLSYNGRQDQLLARADGADLLLRQLALKLDRQRKAAGIDPVQDEKPTLESTTLWDYPKQSYGRKPKGDNKYAGVTPAFLIYNLVKRYTEPGDLIVDPMCGSGTTIDVCKEEGRRVVGYDIVPARSDIIQNDARKIPLEDNFADMVFIDSPYGDNIKYNDHPLSIGNISAESDEFYDELEKVMRESYRILKPGKILGWLIGDQWVKKRFTPVGFRIYERLTRYFEPVDITCIARRSQSSNTGVWHNRALRFNFYLRGFKYLIIVRKREAEGPKARQNRTVKWAYYSRGRRKKFVADAQQ